jgi:O-antigen/teichoic acid export membrane protein
MDDTNNGDVVKKGLLHARHLVKHATLLLSSGVVGYVGIFALNVLLARVLGASRFGAWVVAFATTQVLVTVGLLGTNWILVRHGSYYHGIGDYTRLRRTVHLSIFFSGGAQLFLAAGLFVTAPWLARTFFESGDVAALLRLAALLSPIVGFGQIMLYATQAFKDMRDVALIRNIVQPAARLVFSAIALSVVPTPVAAFVGLFPAEVIVTAAATFALQRRISLLGPSAPIDRGDLIKFALPAWGTKIIENIRAQLFPVLVGSVAPRALSAAAAFVASKRLAVAPGAINAALNQVYIPMGSNLSMQDRRKELSTLFKNMGKWSFTLSFPLFCLQVAFPKELLAIFGADFRSADTTLVVLAFGMLFNFGTGPVTTTLIMSGRSRLALVDYVVVVVVEIALGLWLIPTHGALGAAIALLVGNALNNGVPLWQVWSLLRVHPYRRDHWKPAAAGLVAVVIAKLVVSGIGLSVGVLAAGVAVGVVGFVYLGLLLVLGLSVEDRAAIEALTAGLRRGAKKRGIAEDSRGTT